MLIQRSLPNSLTTELSFVSEFGKQNNTALVCDWSCGGNCETSPNCDKQRNSKFTEEEGNKISCSKNVELSRTSPDISVVDDVCASYASNLTGCVYKRRKMQRNNVNISDCDTGIDNSHSRQLSDIRNSSISGQLPAQNSILTPRSEILEGKNLESLSKLMQYDQHLDREVTLPAESSGYYSHINDSSSSRPVTGEADITITEQFEEFTSSREFCISVLKKHGLLGGVSTTSVHNSSELPGDAIISQACKICGILENPLKMLICDLCEEAFHVSCCNPKVKDLPVDDWYCQPCLRKRPKALRERSSKKKVNISSDLRCKKSSGKGGPIYCMLRDDADNWPDKSVVRIGKDFQVEVPEWTGPISEDSDYYNSSLPVDPAEYACLNVDNAEKPSNSSYFSNWIQCRELVYTIIKDKGNICGKWRRAPLFVDQTNDWDCSCSVPWDPIHADCAVPQELDTDVILKHLEYVGMLRPQMNMNKQKL